MIWATGTLIINLLIFLAVTFTDPVTVRTLLFPPAETSEKAAVKSAARHARDGTSMWS